MPTVHLPDGRIVHFPEGMPAPEIEAAVAELAAQKPSGPNVFGRFGEPGYEPASPGQTLQDMAVETGKGALAGGALKFAGKLPWGRLLTAAGAGAKGAVRDTFIGKGGRAAIKAWGKATPKPAPDPTPRSMPPLVDKAAPRAMPDLRPPAPPASSVAPSPLGPSAKPKLSVKDVAEALRKQYGSEKASQMLYGKTQKGAEAGSVVANAAARKDAIKRLAPMESTLPNAARQQILQTLEQQGPTAEAWNYVTRAPNERARDFMLRLMRQGGK